MRNHQPQHVSMGVFDRQLKHSGSSRGFFMISILSILSILSMADVCAFELCVCVCVRPPRCEHDLSLLRCATLPSFFPFTIHSLSHETNLGRVCVRVSSSFLLDRSIARCRRSPSPKGSINGWHNSSVYLSSGTFTYLSFLPTHPSAIFVRLCSLAPCDLIRLNAFASCDLIRFVTHNAEHPQRFELFVRSGSDNEVEGTWKT